ncbi:MAG: HAMP domain-containing histidine kinase [Candidatus Aminicenantes bacterium]|nr:HAMP domain-containing histidine kinase [Candidatus Aminicenantes bacterium]
MAQNETNAENIKLMEVLDFAFFNLAHELGNPINSIKMTLEVLINNFDDYPRERQMEYLRSLHVEFNRLESLLKAIRSFNTFEQLSIRALDLRSLLQNLLQMMGNELNEKRITLSFSFPQEPLWISGDSRALQQALLNVISNAVDALANRLDPRLGIAVDRQGDSCLIRISDNGGGIPEEKKDQVFLPFASGKPHAAGLGLTMAKKLLTRMDGSIAIDSQPGRGTEVLVTLPAADPHAG